MVAMRVSLNFGGKLEILKTLPLNPFEINMNKFYIWLKYGGDIIKPKLSIISK